VLGHSLPVVFGAGAVGITAMVLPGISGAFILLLLGQYEFLTGTLSAVVDGAVGALTGGSSAGLASGLVTVAAFGSGAVVGLLTVARVIRWALAAYRAATLAFLVSLMVGSLRLPVVRVLDGVAVWTPGAAAAVGGAALAGAAAVLALDRYTADLDY
jgi:putative membrane protein